MTRTRRRGIALALLGAQLAACAPSMPPSSPEIGHLSGNSGVAVREDLSRRFTALIGPQVQIAPPYLDIPDTNIARLRSFLDHKTGETAHQLYVVASYDANHDWTAAHDGAGQQLQFIPISRLPIACEGQNKCSYTEEFAAKFPESEMRDNRGGFSVIFTGQTANTQTVPVSAAQVAAQLAALAELHKQMAASPPPFAAAGR